MKKSAIVSAALGLTLAVSGLTYAIWQQPMNFNGTVDTATFDVQFGVPSTTDPAGTVDPGKAADVASTSVATQADEKGKFTIGTITVTNAYPGYNSTSTFPVINNSSIPVKVTGVAITNNNASEINAVKGANCVADGYVIPAGGSADVVVSNNVLDAANPSSSYTYTVAVTTEQAQ